VVDLTDYQGYHLDSTDHHAGSATEVAAIPLAALMTAALISRWWAERRVWVFLSTVFHSRAVTVLAQVVIVLVEFSLFASALSAGWTVLNNDPTSPSYMIGSMTNAWGSLLFMASAGDQSLRLLNLGTFLQSWTDVSYAVLLGGAILAVVLLMAVLTNGLLWWSAYRASRPARE
jgi:hypothetical protein